MIGDHQITTVVEDVDVEVGYYVQVLGLGRHPDEVVFTGRPRASTWFRDFMPYMIEHTSVHIQYPAEVTGRIYM